MKKPILLLALLSLMFVLKSNAQWQYGIFTPTGGTSILGNTTFDDITFGTHSTPQMTLQNGTGYFGIGTTTPGQMLEVAGGNINVYNDGSYGYMIGGYPELYNYGQGNDLFVGYLAGNIALGYN